ncbi:MAG: indole-3-glycerol-phosphate synthase [Desulfovibrio sp.]|nr:indole-3-glycerol-phosphate synthase [Desulfovibrio sp.]
MLSKFRESKNREIARLRRLAEAGEFPDPRADARPVFSAALTASRDHFAVIAEYKRASPSLGLICDSISPEEAARQYEDAGAAALSILTETDWFRGDFNYLDRAAEVGSLPILRKDFIMDPLQVEMTASSRASALLLIVRLTPDVAVLRDLRELAEKRGLECAVEIFDEADLALARDSGAKLIQVNARDLSALRVNRGAVLRIARENPPERGEIWIAASGVKSRDDLKTSADAGYSAALVGSSLMANGAPGENLRRLLAQ